MTLVLCTTLSGCAERITSDLPAHMGPAAELQCCRRQVPDEDAVPLADVQAAKETVDATVHRWCRFEVAVFGSPLRRDAYGRAPVVGHVVPGEKVTFLDFIDRRLRILGRLVFDGGYWLKVRGHRGDIGWLLAAEVREIRGPCEAEGTALIGR